MTIHLEILHVTLDFALWSNVPDNFVHSLHRVLVSVRILSLSQKMVVNFFIDVFGVLASSDEVVAVHELEDVDVRH